MNQSDTLVFRKHPESRVFVATDDSIIIGRGTLITLLNHLVHEGVIEPQVLEGILEEFHTE